MPDNYTTLIGAGSAKSLITLRANWQTKPQEIERYILEEIRLQLKDKLRGLDLVISAELKKLLKEAIERCSVYDELVNKRQELYFELGAVNSPEAMYDLIRVVQETVYVAPPIIRKLGKKINMSMGLSALNTDFSQALSISSGKYMSINKNAEETEIPWLKWLLSSPPLIHGWDVMFKSALASRTGGAIMIQTKSGGWKLPIEFAGNLKDNFVTRAVKEYNITGKLNRFLESTINLLLR
jgi:hypothetical protein